MRDLFRLIPLLILLAVYAVQVNLVPARYGGFIGLEWETLPGCGIGGGYRELQPNQRSVGTWISGGGQNVGVCRSKPFHPDGDVLEFEYAGYPSSKPGEQAWFQIIRGDGSVIQLALPYPHLIHLGETWRRHRVKLEKLGADEQIRFEVIDQANIEHGGWLAFRDRVSVFRSDQTVEAFHKILNQWPIAILLWIGLAAALIRLPLEQFSRPGLFLLFLTVTFGIFFRAELYFFWDEWHVLTRLAKLGTEAYFETHNEHFIPLFLAFYRLESITFGDHYQLYVLLSFVFHALNGVLTSSVLEHFCRPSPRNLRIVRLIGLFFIINAVHCSVLHWSFLQAIILCQTATLLSFLAGLQYCRTGLHRMLLLGVLAAATAPFLFGGGLLVGPQLILLAVFLALFSSDGLWVGIQGILNQRRRLLTLGGVLLLLGVALVALYAIPRAGSGYGVDVPNLRHRFGDVTKLVGYVFVGSELGTIVRGLGFFPIMELEPTLLLFPPSWMELFDQKRLVWAAVVGGGLLFVLPFMFVLWVLVKRDRFSWGTVIVGQLFLLSAFFLQALGRSRWGMLMSLAPRYQYAALFGLLLILLPFLVGAIHRNQRWTKHALFGCGVVVFALQLGWGAQYRFFAEVGQMNRGFVEQMFEWRYLVDRGSRAHRGLEYDRQGTPYYGLSPWIPWRLAPDYHPDQVYEALELLGAGDQDRRENNR